MARTRRNGHPVAAPANTEQPEAPQPALPTPPIVPTPSTASDAPASVSDLPADGEASWTEQDISRFIMFLIEHKSEAGDGGHYKMKTFKPASVILEKYRTQGGPKTPSSCKNKLVAVCISDSLILTSQCINPKSASEDLGRYRGNSQSVWRRWMG